MIDFIEAGFELALQLVAQVAQALRLFRHLALADCAGFAEADDSGDVQRAGTHAALVSAAIHLRGDLYARIFAPHIECADALRPVHFMRA